MPETKAPKNVRCNWCGIFMYAGQECFADEYLAPDIDYYCLKCAGVEKAK